MTSVFSWQNSVSLCPASFCTPRPNVPVNPGVSWLHTFAFQSPIIKRTSFFWCSLLHLLFDHFPFALIHEPNIPGSYAILLFIALDLTSITSHIHNWVVFLLLLHLFILSGVIFPLISSSILGTYWSGEFIFQCPICLFAFSYCSWSSQGKNTEVVCHSLLQWITFCQTSPPWPICVGQPHMAWLSFIELDKAVVHVISFLWLWFSVCLTSDGEGYKAYGSFLIG